MVVFSPLFLKDPVSLLTHADVQWCLGDSEDYTEGEDTEQEKGQGVNAWQGP